MDDIFEKLYLGVRESRASRADIENLLRQIQDHKSDYSPMWHALGFVHCKLYESTKGTLRLHIWPANARSSQEQRDKVHDHIFDLKSLILCGQVKNRTYQLGSPTNCQSASHQIVEVKYSQSGSTLAPTHKYVSPSLKDEFTTTKGHYYTVERGEFHESVVCAKTLTSTLVVTYNHSNSQPAALSSTQVKADVNRERVPYGSNEWSQLIKRVLKEMISDRSQSCGDGS